MRGIAEWRGGPLNIGGDGILRVQGYRDPRQVRRVLIEAADRAAVRAAAISAPEARCLRLPIEACSGASLRLAGGFAFECPIFGKLLGACDEAVVFVLTVGPRLEAEIAGCHADEPLDAYFLDAAGWLLVEQASRQLRFELSRELAAERRMLTARLGPGYDYRNGAVRARWPLEQQQELFRVFGEAELPVMLLDSSAMMPRLSRSGLFGVYPRL